MPKENFRYTPTEVIDRFISDPGFDTPTKQAVDQAVSIIVEGLNRRDAFGLCLNMSRDDIVVLQVAPTLAMMFHEKHPCLPQHWKETPGITRTILSIAATLDLGILQAMRLAQTHSEVNPHLETRINQISKFLNDLQAKNSDPENI